MTSENGINHLTLCGHSDVFFFNFLLSFFHGGVAAGAPPPPRNRNQPYQSSNQSSVQMHRRFAV